MNEGATKTTLVLGVGNLLWADEGFGVRCIEELERRYLPPEGVIFMDGGTQGLYLTPHVQNCARLLIFDAIDYGDQPGTLRVVRGEEVPKFGGVRKMSLHQTGLQDVLHLADLLGDLPTELVLVGVQAGELDDWGGSLTDVVSRRLDEALAIGIEELLRWGVELEPRPEGSPQLASALERSRFEAGRSEG